MEPSFVFWFSTSSEDTTYTSGWYMAASVCFSLAIIIQLPSLFLEALSVGFYKFPSAPNRTDEEKGWSSMLLAVLFHLSFASFVGAIWTLMVAEAIPMFIVFTWMLSAPVVVVGVGCFRHGLFVSAFLLALAW